MPKWVVALVLRMLRSSVQAKAGFDLNDVSAREHVARSFVPCLFLAVEADSFISSAHSQALHDAYAGDKVCSVVTTTTTNTTTTTTDTTNTNADIIIL